MVNAAAGSAPPQVDMAQRFVVIRCLRAQCESGQLLVDLFVNYDCDLEGQNLFERMVLALVRLAQGNVPQDATTQVIAEEQAMRLAVLLSPPCCGRQASSLQCKLQLLCCLSHAHVECMPSTAVPLSNCTFVIAICCSLACMIMGCQACKTAVQALQCLVNILRSLVEWYTAGMPAEQPNQRITAQSVGEDNVQSWENLTASGPSQLFNETPADDRAEPGSPLRPTLRRDTSVLQSMMMSTGTLVSCASTKHA